MTDELRPCPFCGGDADVMLSQSRWGQSYTIHHSDNGVCPAAYVASMQFATEAEAIEAWNARAELGSYDRNDEIYNTGFRNGIQAVFQQLECIEDYKGLQDLIAEYWGEGEGYDKQ